MLLVAIPGPSQRPDASVRPTDDGYEAGLVVITPACGFVNPTGGMIIGVLSAVVPYIFVVFVKSTFRYDDALDTFGQMNPLIAFLDRMDRRPDVIARRRRSYELLGLRAGAKVVDVGCGAGTAVRDLASYVAPGGSAIGVDFGPLFIEAATARAAKTEVDVAFHVANAEELPFASESLDGYRAERPGECIRPGVWQCDGPRRDQRSGAFAQW